MTIMDSFMQFLFTFLGVVIFKLGVVNAFIVVGLSPLYVYYFLVKINIELYKTHKKALFLVHIVATIILILLLFISAMVLGV